jgi:hypothetical protein
MKIASVSCQLLGIVFGVAGLFQSDPVARVEGGLVVVACLWLLYVTLTNRTLFGKCLR